MKELINRMEAAKMLGMTLNTLDDARRSGQIAYIQYVKRGSVYFTEEALEEYVERCTHKARPVEFVSTYRRKKKSMGSLRK